MFKEILKNILFLGFILLLGIILEKWAAYCGVSLFGLASVLFALAIAFGGVISNCKKKFGITYSIKNDGIHKVNFLNPKKCITAFIELDYRKPVDVFFEDDTLNIDGTEIKFNLPWKCPTIACIHSERYGVYVTLIPESILPNV